ncbi:MAG: nucleotidyltransferase family protein [Planctomycetota bacterium]
MTQDDPQVQVFALIPAAGASTRMGRPKQLLPLGKTTLLERVIEAVLWGDIDGLCVLTSSVIDGQLALSEDPRFLVAINDNTASEMIDSVRMGIAALYARCHVRDRDGFLVCPGDMAEVSADDVRALTGAYREQPGRIVIATHTGQRGHPMVFPASLAAEVRQIRDGGLKVLAERHAADVRLVERTSPGVIRDVDMPEDFERLNEGER